MKPSYEICRKCADNENRQMELLITNGFVCYLHRKREYTLGDEPEDVDESTCPFVLEHMMRAEDEGS